MSKHERRYQKYLDRKRQKHGNKATEAGRMAPQIAAAANSPIHEALVPAKLFELGMGNLVFSRLLPDGRIAMGAFLLDVFCLGVKDAFVAIVTKAEYGMRRSSWSAAESLQPMDPACFRKLVEGGVAYAQDLGFSPHADYAVASQIFGDVQATECSTRFEYGHDGKPFYISGPHETATQVQNILEQLERRLGPGNFDYLVMDQ
ncbi:MAG TPA: hypothetical protein VKO18_17605 [Terriglobia bacterium]|nr:hypothetical protein [Terriglobia bacterium]